jgi:hypothetical protein
VVECTKVFATGSTYEAITNGRTPRAESNLGLSRFKIELDRASGTEGWVIHDLRRTSRSLMSRAGVTSDHLRRAIGAAGNELGLAEPLKQQREILRRHRSEWNDQIEHLGSGVAHPPGRR